MFFFASAWIVRDPHVDDLIALLKSVVVCVTFRHFYLHAFVLVVRFILRLRVFS